MKFMVILINSQLLSLIAAVVKRCLVRLLSYGQVQLYIRTTRRYEFIQKMSSIRITVG